MFFFFGKNLCDCLTMSCNFECLPRRLYDFKLMHRVVSHDCLSVICFLYKFVCLPLFVQVSVFTAF